MCVHAPAAPWHQNGFPQVDSRTIVSPYAKRAVHTCTNKMLGPKTWVGSFTPPNVQQSFLAPESIPGFTNPGENRKTCPLLMRHTSQRPLTCISETKFFYCHDKSQHYDNVYKTNKLSKTLERLHFTILPDKY